MRAIGLGEVGIEAAVRFRQRRFTRGMAVDLALGIGVARAGGVGFALAPLDEILGHLFNHGMHAGGTSSRVRRRADRTGRLQL